MDCEEVQSQLAHADVFGLSSAVEAHVHRCEDCRSIKLVYATIDESLRGYPRWEPPTQFTQITTSHGLLGLGRRTLSPGVTLRRTFHASALGLVTAIAVYLAFWYLFLNVSTAVEFYSQLIANLSGTVAANSSTVSWISAALTLLLSASLRHRLS
jgi:hypothetical protein